MSLSENQNVGILAVVEPERFASEQVGDVFFGEFRYGATATGMKILIGLDGPVRIVFVSVS